MAFSIANPLNAYPLDGMDGSGNSGFSLTQNYAAGAYSPLVSIPISGSGSGEQPDWLKTADDIIRIADKITSIYERYDYPAWKRALDAKEIEAYRAAQEEAKAAQAQAAAGSAGGVLWVWVVVAVAAGVVALVLVK